MRTIKYLAFGVLASLTLISCSAGTSKNTNACSQSYYVSPNGDDSSATGTQLAPFQTIGRVQQIIRTNPNRTSCNITVNIESGIYNLSEPLIFTNQDSAGDNNVITYKAVNPNTNVIISGAIPVTNFTSLGNNLYKASNLNVPNGIMPRQFYINDVHAIRARSNYTNPGLEGIESLAISESTLPSGYIISTLVAPLPISNPQYVEAVTSTQWKMMRCGVESKIDGVDGYFLQMKNPCWKNANTYPEPWNSHILSWLENAPEFVTYENSWYYNPIDKSLLYYTANGTPSTGYLPTLEKLIDIQGTANAPVKNLIFDGLTFKYATWLEPNSNNGYVSDQSSMILLGDSYESNVIGHQKVVYNSGSNISIRYGKNITFKNSKFSHLGGVGLALYAGSQNNNILNNLFYDISSSAIQIGEVNEVAMRANANDIVKNNLVQNNSISYTGQDYYDAAGIYVGFTESTAIIHNDISHTSWSSIAIGWGWGLFDKSGFPGLPHATYNMWGNFNTNTVQSRNTIRSNKFSYFLEQLWDGCAIYTNGAQGTSYQNGLNISLNVASNKRAGAGSNIYYTDGGSQYVTLTNNASYNNPTGSVYFGPCLDPQLIPYGTSFYPLCLGNGIVSYGAQMGGCLPVGNLTYQGNYFAEPNTFFGPSLCSNPEIPPYPVDLNFSNNYANSITDIPNWIINQAGVQR